MGYYQRIFRRGTRYWYRRTEAAGGGRRIDIRRSLGTSDIHEAKRRASMMDIASADDLRLNFTMFRKNSGSKTAAPLPEPEPADIESAARAYQDRALRNYLARHAGRSDSSDFVFRQTENVADFDFFDILIRTGATRQSLNRYRIDEEIALLSSEGSRRSHAIDRFQDLLRDIGQWPVTLAERDALYRGMGRAVTATALETLDRLMLEAHRDAVAAAEHRRQQMVDNLGLGTTIAILMPPNDEPIPVEEATPLPDPSPTPADAEAAEEKGPDTNAYTKTEADTAVPRQHQWHRSEVVI